MESVLNSALFKVPNFEISKSILVAYTLLALRSLIENLRENQIEDRNFKEIKE